MRLTERRPPNLKSTFRGVSRRCNPPTALHPKTAAAELPAPRAPAKEVDKTASRTIGIKLMHRGGEGGHENMEYLGEAERFPGVDNPRRAESDVARK